MKRFFITSAIILSCATVLIAGMDKVIAKIPKVSMGAILVSDTTDRITGYINRLDYSFGNSTSALDIVSVVASNTLTGLTTTLPYPGNTSTDVSYQLTNYVSRLSLYDEAITITATNAVYTNQSVMVTVFYDRP